MESIEIKRELENVIERDKDLLMYHKLAPIKSQLTLNNQIFNRSYIKLLTYNLFLRPPLIKTNQDDYKNERLALFCDHLNDYDIICIQELFETLNQRKHDLIRHATQKGFFFFIESPMPEVFDSFVVDAGILIFSRFPIKNWTFRPFPHGVYADGLSQKGFLYAQIEVKTNIIHLITTHLQADDTHYNICNEIRLDQLKIINHFISNHLKKHYYKGDKIILAGDFNVDGNKYQYLPPIGNANKEIYLVEYDKMMEILNSNCISAIDLFSPQQGIKQSTYGSVDQDTKQIESVLSSKSHSIAQMAIDYIFDVSFENESSSIFVIDKLSLKVEKFLTTKRNPLTQLSDHYGLSCHIVYNINGINGNIRYNKSHEEETKQQEIPDDIIPLVNY